MALGDGVVLVFQNKGQVNVITGAPHIPLAVEEPFQTIAYLLATGVELVGGQGPVASQFQVTVVPILDRFQIIGGTVQCQAGHALGIGEPHANLLQLVVVGLEHHVFGGGVAVQLGGHHQQGIVLAAFGDQTQIGGQKGASTAGQIVVLVVAVGTGVILLVPAQVARVGIVVLVEVRAVLILPGAFIAVRQSGFFLEGTIRAAVADVVTINRQRQVHQAVGVFGHELGEIQLITLPAIAIARQGQRFLPQVATAARVHVGFIQLAALQIAANVVIEYPERLDFHRAHAHRFKRHAKLFSIGQDGAITHKTHTGLIGHQGDGFFQLVRQATLTGGAQAAVNHQLHIVFQLILRINAQGAAIHFHSRRLAIQRDQPFQVLGGLQGFGKVHLDVGFGVTDRPHIGYREVFQCRHRVMTVALVVHAKGRRIPAQ